MTPVGLVLSGTRKCRRHHFSTVYHHFRPFFRPPWFEIRSMKQGSDRFPALSGPLKNGENGENGAARRAPFFFRYFKGYHGETAQPRFPSLREPAHPTKTHRALAHPRRSAKQQVSMGPRSARVAAKRACPISSGCRTSLPSAARRLSPVVSSIRRRTKR